MTVGQGRGRRNKGANGEREVVELAKAAGFTGARRNFGSGSQGGGDVVGVPGVHLEAKRQETTAIWKWISQARDEAASTDVPVVAFRRNGEGWYAAVPLDEFLALVAARATS